MQRVKGTSNAAEGDFQHPSAIPLRYLTGFLIINTSTVWPFSRQG
jgi:hypothetical protein